MHLDVDRYEELLKESAYDATETEFLVTSFRNGFDIGYDGPQERQSEARNIPFTVGNHIEMWNKIMKEVREKRVAGPFDSVPFKNYVQLPIGLVPKANNKTHLIFHLSYDFGGEDGSSVNMCTLKEMCLVKYNDLDTAINEFLKASAEAELKNGSKLYFWGKTDLTSAFHVLCMNKRSFCWLVFKAIDPSDRKVKYFVDKCLPFGASISCAHYQCFSNSLCHIVSYRTKKKSITNYLDDFLFIVITRWICNQMIQRFLDLCAEINIPVAAEKTEWATTIIVFLGILLDGEHLLMSIPIEKQQKALRLFKDLEGKKKVMVKQLQVLTGYLNFLSKAIVPGRVFT